MYRVFVIHAVDVEADTQNEAEGMYERNELIVTDDDLYMTVAMEL